MTNLMWARVSALGDVKASGNWMYAAKLPGEGARMYDACGALKDAVLALGVGIEGGKDSLSMAAREAERLGRRYVTDMVCTTDDVAADLPQFEPASFARCRFAPRTHAPKPDDGAVGDGVDGGADDTGTAPGRGGPARGLPRAERGLARRAREQGRNTGLEERGESTSQRWFGGHRPLT